MLERIAGGRYLAMFSGIYVAMFLIRLAFGIVVITFGSYVPADDFVFGLLAASSPTLELVTVAFAGVVIDKHGKKGALLAGLTLGALALFALALTDNLLLLGLINGLHGISAALVLVTSLALVASYASPETRGREMGLFNFANMFGWIAGFALGSFLLDHVSNLRYTFVLAGTLAAAGIVYAHFTVREAGAGGRVERLDVKELLSAVSRRGVLLLSAAWLVVFLFLSSFVTFLSRDTTGDAGTGGVVALVILLAGGGFMASQIVFGRLSDRVGREPVMLLGALGFLALMITISVLAVASMDTPLSTVVSDVAARSLPHAVLVFGAIAAFSFAALAFPPAGLAALADEAKNRAEGTTMSVYPIVLNLGFIVGPPLRGAVERTVGGLGVISFFLVLAIVLTGIVLLRFLDLRTRGSRGAQAAAEGTPLRAGGRGSEERR